MSEKFQNKYRISSSRLQNWDYASKGAYFITICTQNREHYFGEIENREMRLNDIGKIVESEWIKTPEIRPDMNLELGAFVVMPNHFHAILIIGANEYNSQRLAKRIDRDAMHRVSTSNTTNTNHNKFGPQLKNLASIIRGFKSSVTKYAWISGPDFAWQPRFHDHIIRNTIEFERIQNYIVDNPENWKEDKFNK
jgi:REP element-mobilizing transposase RayT